MTDRKVRLHPFDGAELAAMNGLRLSVTIDDCRKQLRALAKVKTPLAGANAIRYRFFSETLRNAIAEQNRRTGSCP